MPFFRPTPRTVVNTKELGERSEAAAISKLMECGYVVLVPFGNTQPYDMVIEDGDGQFWRLQCKSGWLHNGAVRFNTGRVKVSKKEYRRAGYKGQIDYFIVHARNTGKVYLVPVDEVGDHSAYLRVDQPHRSVLPNTRWAKDYLRHEAAWVAVETEYSVLNLVFCHQSPTKTCVRSDPEVGQLLGQCTSPGRDQPIHEETLELQASRRLEG